MAAALQSGNRTVSTILFDMDNTLFDFVKAQLFGCEAVRRHLMVSGDAEDLFSYFRRPVHGFEHHDNIRDYLVDCGVYSERAFSDCCVIYEREKVAAIVLYPGIRRALDTLRTQGLTLGIVTDAYNGNAVKRLEKAGLLSYFSAVISPDMSGAAKPDPASFLLALECLGARAGQTVLVGDSIRRDIIPAKKIGMVTVYARYGDRYGSGQVFECMPDYIAGDVQEIGQILAGLTGS